MFEVHKGTKQGDPISSLLFTTVLQVALKDDLPRWQKNKGMGVCLGDGDHDCLTNLRFADDVLLFASTKEHFLKHVVRLQKQHREVGLKTHPGKTKILSSQSSKSRLTTSKWKY